MNHIVDLTSNGRMFPLSAMDNLRQYKLKSFDKDNTSNIKIENIHNKIMQLQIHQAIAGSIMSYKSKLRGMLLYYGLGSGKTGSAINVYNQLYKHNPMWNVFIIIKSALHDTTWVTDLKKFLPKEEFNERMANISFVHYDAPNADKQFLEKVRESDASKQNIYIFDEVHNFIRNVYSNVTKTSGKRASTIYNHIVQEKKDPKNASRVLLLSGTPAINEPFELALLFNLLRPGSFPNTESKFNETYVATNEEKHRILRPDAVNMFQRRILGLVSYYIGQNPKFFPRKETIIKEIQMSKYQQSIYKHFVEMEYQVSLQNKNSTVYSVYSRQSSSFVFPSMGKLTGENRPRPAAYRISEKEAEEIIKGNMEKALSVQKDLDISKVQKNHDMYIKAMHDHIYSFREYLNNKRNDEQDRNDNKSLKNDIEIFKKKYKHNFEKFWEGHTKKSKLLIALYNCSCKYTAAMFYTLKSKRPFYIFSNFVKMEGLEMIAVYLEQFGYKNYRNGSKEGFGYTEYHGSISKQNRAENVEKFKKASNMYGKEIKCMLMAPAAAEGISFKYIEMAMVMDPHWNEVRIRQVIGRGLRMDSHVELPEEEKFIQIYRLHAITDDDKPSRDQKVFRLAEKKEEEIKSFIDPIMSASIDCELFKEHNMVDEEYSCFKFNETSYFNKVPGPAFKDDTTYDFRIKDGSNSLNTVTEKIKTYKIKAQIKTGKDEYAVINNFWYNPVSGVVYDIDLEFPIGRILKTNNIPHKLNNIYVIEDVIDIPDLYKT